MNRIIALPLQALVPLVATIGVQPRPEPVGAHQAIPGALWCARRRGAADDVVGALTRRGGGPVPRPASGRAVARRRVPARGDAMGVGVPEPTRVAPAGIAGVQTRRREVSVPRPSGRPPFGSAAAGSSHCMGLQEPDSDVPPPPSVIDVAAACSSSLRQAGGGFVRRAPSPPRARPAGIVIAREPSGVGNARRPRAPRNGNVNADVSRRGLGLGALAAAVTFAPLGDPAKAVWRRERAFPVTVWRQFGDIARTVPFLSKWDNALLPIAKRG
jgi:hypothetical protein